MQKIDITGIIMPHKWSEDGEITQIAIYADNEDIFLIEHCRLERELMKHINRKVEVRGKKSERLDGKIYIGVQDYFILQENAR